MSQSLSEQFETSSSLGLPPGQRGFEYSSAKEDLPFRGSNWRKRFRGIKLKIERRRTSRKTRMIPTTMIVSSSSRDGH